jgi:hypothetical protein
MTDEQLKARVGVGLMLGQIAVIGAVIASYLAGGMKFEEASLAVALLTPMFAVHVTSIVRYFIKHKTVIAAGVPLAAPYVFMALVFPAGFIAFLLLVILLRTFGVGFVNIGQLQFAFGIAQTLFGVYLGLFISSLFE